MRYPLLIAALGVFASACGAPAPTDFSIGAAVPSATDPGTLVYQPLEDGAELVLEAGAQGGFHVWVQLRVHEDTISGMGPRPYVQRWGRRVDSGVLVSRAERNLAFVEAPDAPGMVEVDGAIPIFLCPSPVGIEVAEVPIELKMEISADEESSSARASGRFTALCPQGDQNAFCSRICYGE